MDIEIKQGLEQYHRFVKFAILYLIWPGVVGTIEYSGFISVCNHMLLLNINAKIVALGQQESKPQQKCKSSI